jgi:hypothetical protein
MDTDIFFRSRVAPKTIRHSSSLVSRGNYQG